MYLTIKTTFDAAHRLQMDSKNEDENKVIYGKCYNLHGHTYRLNVSIKGDVQADGMIINFKEMKQIVKEVTDPLDHSILNDYVKLPTAENIIVYLWERMEPTFMSKGITLYELVLYENDDAYVTVQKSDI